MALYKTDIKEQNNCSNKIFKCIRSLRLKYAAGGAAGRAFIIIWDAVKSLWATLVLISLLVGFLSAIIAGAGVLLELNDKVIIGAAIVHCVCAAFAFISVMVFTFSLFTDRVRVENSRFLYCERMLQMCTMRRNEYIEITDEGINIMYLESEKRRRGSSGRIGKEFTPNRYRKIELSRSQVYRIIHSSELGIYLIAGNAHEYVVESNDFADYSYVNMPWKSAAGVNDKCIMIIDTCENTETGMKDIESILNSCLNRITEEVDYEKAVNFIWNTHENFSACISGT